MHYEYQPKGVCASNISFDMKDNIITNIKFTGGCPGYSKIFAKALDGWKKEDIIHLCQGNLCRDRGTSCADQLAKALESIR